MSTDTALIEKREELKRRLAAGEYKTLVDIFLEWFDRLLRKITRRSGPFPLWLITIILIAAFVLISFVAIYISGDWTTTHKYFELLGLGDKLGVLWIISQIILTIVPSVVINRYINRILVLWRDDMLDATESVASLEEFEDWLKKTCNWRLNLLMTIIGGLLFSSYTTSIANNLLGEFVGYGFTFSNTIVSIFAFASIYLYLMVILLSARLRRYDLKLFAADPASSELVSRLSSELSFIVYFVAALGAIGALNVALDGFSIVDVVLLIGVWLPIIAFFILNQTSLSSMIQRVKWKTLNEIQMKVEKLQISKNFGNQETMDAIKRLMDYHNQVKATRDSALDFKAYLSFINSLLLPLLAFLLGNLDLMLALFARKP